MYIVIKNLVLAAALMTIGTAVVGARQIAVPPAAVSAATNAVGPKIQFAKVLHDFGRMRAGEPVKYTYIFTNTGDRMLILNSVQPQCGCTTAGDWTKQVEPGKTGRIPIQFNTANYNGPVFKQVTVNCNVSTQSMLFLQLKGTVYKAVDVIPPYAIMNVPPDADTASLVVTITNNTEEPLFLFSPESNNRMISAQLVTNQPGKGYHLKLSLVPPLSRGNAQAQIRLRTSWTNTPIIPVSVVANIQPAVMAMPSYLTVAPGPLPNAVTNSVVIQNNSTNRLELSDPVVNVPGVDAQIQETQPGKTFTVALVFSQGFLAPQGQPVELSVKTSNPRQPLVKVTVMQLPHSPAPFVPVPSAPAVAPVTPVKPGPLTPPVAPVRRVSSATTKPPPPPPPPPLPPSL